MFKGLFGPTSLPAMLRGGLEETTATHKVIAERVSNALASSTSVDFGNELQARQGQAKLSEADLQRDMASLADNELRYEADAKLLQQAYAQLRSAITDRG